MLKVTRSKMYLPILLPIILFKCFTLLIAVESPVPPKMENLEKIPFKGKPVPPCRACRNLVDSFLKAVGETMRMSFEGGDADWEKQKLGSYDNSELRFIEIQEQVCADVGLGKDQCYNLAELHESELENWFYEERHKNIDLFEFLCINHLKICCPNNTYGSDCVPCPGGIESPCGGHGKCLKGGTREEPASCFCDAGYTGELCDVCAKGYYQEVGEVFSCKICDKACKGHCRGPGPKNCEVCSFGYHFIPDEGCVEHFNDYKNPIKITDDASNETEDSKSKLESDLEDATVDSTQHSEHSEL